MSPSCLVGFAIVVVEDYDDARRYSDLFLRQLGAKVMVASNAFEALELIKSSRPDLVLSDIKMPGMDGFELLDEIRALGPEAGGNVPVVAMSAFFSQQNERAPSSSANSPSVPRRSLSRFEPTGTASIDHSIKCFYFGGAVSNSASILVQARPRYSLRRFPQSAGSSSSPSSPRFSHTLSAQRKVVSRKKAIITHKSGSSVGQMNDSGSSINCPHASPESWIRPRALTLPAQ
jgi:CheY-like chemotaxis protein